MFNSFVPFAAKPPCKNCQKRKLNCHDSCDDYKEFKAACDEERMAQHNEFLKDEYGKPLGRRR